MRGVACVSRVERLACHDALQRELNSGLTNLTNIKSRTGRVVQCDTSINQLLRINQQLSNDLQVNIINLQAGKQSEVRYAIVA